VLGSGADAWKFWDERRAGRILQADLGCDFDYLETGFGAPVSEPVIY
jgi:hypothetical protein